MECEVWHLENRNRDRMVAAKWGIFPSSPQFFTQAIMGAELVPYFLTLFWKFLFCRVFVFGYRGSFPFQNIYSYLMITFLVYRFIRIRRFTRHMKNTKKTTRKNNAVLLMLSGGRDSFLSACRLINQGLFVRMIAYDNGCIANIEAAKMVADRIITAYGENCATFEGVYSIASSLYRFQKNYLYEPIKNSSRQYPDLRPAQLPCLSCHTGMYLESIAYCKTHDISKLADGIRKSQKFFVELPAMVKKYRTLTKKNGIELLLPVYDLKDDWERKLELTDYNFIPKTLEAQCWIGYPLGKELNSKEIQSLLAYYDNEIEPQVQSLIDAKVKSLSVHRRTCEKRFVVKLPVILSQ